MQWWLRVAGGQRFKGGCIWWANLRKVFDILHLRSGMSVKAIFWEVRHVKCFSIKSVTDLIFTFHLPPVWSRYIVFCNEFVASAYWLMIHSTTNDVIKIRRYSWSSALQRIANSGRLKPNSQRKTELNSTELNDPVEFSSVFRCELGLSRPLESAWPLGFTLSIFINLFLLVVSLWRWRGGLVVGRRTCDLVVAGSRPGRDAAA